MENKNTNTKTTFAGLGKRIQNLAKNTTINTSILTKFNDLQQKLLLKNSMEDDLQILKVEIEELKKSISSNLNKIEQKKNNKKSTNLINNSTLRNHKLTNNSSGNIY